MTIEKKQDGRCLTVAVGGRLDTTTAPQLDDALQGLDSVEALTLDFGELAYVSSAGLRVLLSTQKKMNQLGGKMVVRNVCEDIMDVFDLTGFSDILTIEA